MPFHYPIIVLAPLVGLIANVPAHVVLSRMRNGERQMLSLLGGMIAGLVCTVGVSLPALLKAEVTADLYSYLVFNIVTYMALAWCYFHFVNLNLSSLRIRLLNEMIQAPEPLLEEDILRRYNAGHIIDKRLERLAEWGHLVVKDGKYFVSNPAFVLLFDIFEVLKLAILGRGNRLLAGMTGAGAEGTQESQLGIAGAVKGAIFLFLRYDFCRFLIAGGINTLFSYILYASLVLLGLDYRVTLTICSVITIIWNYNTTGRFVFGNRGAGLIFKFVSVYGIIYVLNLFALMFLVKRSMGPLVSQALVTPLIVVVSFSLNKFWVFRRAA